MADMKEVFLELEARGALSPEQQAVVSELRDRGELPNAQDYEIRRELNMSPKEYEKHNRARVARGGPNREQPTSFGLLTDQVMDVVGVQDEMVGAGEAYKAFAKKAGPLKMLGTAFLGAAAAAAPGAAGHILGRIDPEASEAASAAYDKAAERVRAERRVAREKFGIAPDIVGGLGSSALSKGGQVVSKGVNALRGFLSTVGQSAKAGAKAGAVAGFAQGEGGVTNRLVGAGYGAGTGAVAAPLISHVAAPAAVGIVRGVINAPTIVPNAARAIRQRVSSDPDAVLSRWLNRQGGVREARRYLDEGEQLSRYGKTQTDLPETIADTGPAMRRLTRAVEGQPGEGATAAETFLNTRQRGSGVTVPAAQRVPGQHQRVNDQLARGLKVGKADYHKTDAKLAKEQEEAANKFYTEFRAMKGADGEPIRIEVGEILRRSEMADADLTHSQKAMMAKARREFMDADVLRDMGTGMNNEPFLGKQAVAGVAPTTRLTAARFDNGKKALDGMIQKELDNGQEYNASLLIKLQKELIGLADEASTRPMMKVTTVQTRTPVMETRTIQAYNAKMQLVPYQIKVPKVDAQGNPVYATVKRHVPVLDKNGKPLTESVYAKARDAHGTPAGIRAALRRGRTFMKGDSEVTAAEYQAMSTAEKRAFRIGMARQARVELGRKTTGSDMVRYFDTPNMREVLGEVMSSREFQRFVALNEREGRMLSSLRATQGTRTTPLREDINDLNWMQRQAEHIRQSGGVTAYMTSAIADRMAKVIRMREEDSLALARALFETDRAKQRVILDRVEKTYGKPRTQRGIAAAVREVRRLEGAARRKIGTPVPAGLVAGSHSAIREEPRTAR